MMCKKRYREVLRRRNAMPLGTSHNVQSSKEEKFHKIKNLIFEGSDTESLPYGRHTTSREIEPKQGNGTIN